MKTILSVIFLLTSLSVWAGAEEHQQAQKCYSLIAIDAQRATEFIPTQICLETIQIDVATNTVEVYSYFNPTLYIGMKLDNLIRVTDDFYSFKSSNVFHFTDNDQTGQLERLTIILSGRVDFVGFGNPAELNMVVKQDTRFNPHSAIHSNFYTYELQ